ncbi:MAG: hypothetical protein E6K02_06855 [Methanobacteriota archaeon]|nr:MAG: hypothetical protein E6K02_06855 [Euryarchaeota archaeon]
MTSPDVPHGNTILAPLPGESQLGGVLLRGAWRDSTESKIDGGTAFFVELDDPSQDLLRVHAADPRFVLVDLETLPPSRLPGMRQYIGGAFVTLYGNPTGGGLPDSSRFTRYLGTAEVLAREGQQLVEIPDSAHAYDAAQVITLAKLDFSVDLEFTVKSLEKAADILTQVGKSGVPPFVQLGRLLAMWGSYFGESLIHDYGGRWFMDPRLGNVILIPRGLLPPVKVIPYGVIEDMIRKGDSSLLGTWLARIESANNSTDFQPSSVQ